MQIKPFATEQFYAEYEFTTPYQLCNSDCETVGIAELLEMADIPLAKLGSLTLGYTEPQGNPTLREMIADTYAAAGTDDVIVLGSPVEGIFLAAHAILEPGDEVIGLTPAYDALLNLFEAVVGERNLIRWPFTPAPTSWELDLDHLRRLISSRTKLIVVNFPHNPTGYLPDPRQQAELVQLVEQQGIWLFSDEMYAGLFHSGTSPIPSAADLYTRAIVLSGLSKTYGLPGLRSGWLIVQDKALRKNLMNWKFYTSICAAAPSEFLAMAAWQVRDRLRLKNIAQIEQNLQIADAFFARWPDTFTWRYPRAGSTALIGMNVPSVSALAVQLAAEAGVLVHPATTLGADDRHMRMGFGRRGFAQALQQFESYLSRHL